MTNNLFWSTLPHITKSLLHSHSTQFSSLRLSLVFLKLTRAFLEVQKCVMLFGCSVYVSNFYELLHSKIIKNSLNGFFVYYIKHKKVEQFSVAVHNARKTNVRTFWTLQRFIHGYSCVKFFFSLVASTRCANETEFTQL